MKTNNKKNVLLAFCITGLILVTLPLSLRNNVALPDSLSGFITGCGIGLELLGITLMMKRKYQ